MVRGDEPESQTRGRHLFQKLQDQRRIGEQDVGIVGRRLVGEYRRIDLIVEPLQGGVMHPEGVLRKEDLLLVEIGKHAVRPVEHPRFHERERAVAEAERFAVFDGRDLPIDGQDFLQALCPDGRCEDLLRIHRRDDLGQASRMVELRVEGDDIVNLGGIDDGRYPVHHLLPKGGLHRIDQGDLVGHDQVGIVGAPPFGHIPVEIPDVPVYSPHPPHIIRQLGRP